MKNEKMFNHISSNASRHNVDMIFWSKVEFSKNLKNLKLPNCRCQKNIFHYLKNTIQIWHNLIRCFFGGILTENNIQ